MKLYTAQRAPNPRRVDVFLAEKGLELERVFIDLNAGEQRSPAFLARNPMARVPVLELDDGRTLSETRAICSYLEARYPEPNLMGQDAEERAFIEMADRHAELGLLATIANAVRHGHPGLATLEQPQFPDFAQAQLAKLPALAAVFDRALQGQDWIAGARFTIADITACCALDFARGLLRWSPRDAGLDALQAWRERVAARPSFKR